MKNLLRINVLIIMSIILFGACADTESERNDRKNLLVQGSSDAEILKIIEAENKPIIVERKEFFGVKIGEPIENFGNLATLGKISKKGVVLDVYYIEQRGVEIGYFLPDSKNDTLVGNIFIQSEKAVTEDGFKVGTSFEEILEKLPAVKVLELENEIYAVVANISYKLDYRNYGTVLSRTSIPKKSKILEIIIRK